MNILDLIQNVKPDNLELGLRDIANWTYLNIYLQSYTAVSENDILYLIKLEYENKRRQHMMQRLYSKYLTIKRKNDLALLLKEIL